jgi:hypothetical protein
VSEQRKKLDGIIGLVTIGSSITGVASFIAALFPLFGADYAAAGLCLIAAALSFGLLANAVLRG